MILWFVIASLGLLAGCVTSSTSAPEGMAQRMAQRVMLREKVWGSYTLDLAWESMLEFDRVADCPALRNYVLGKIEQRG